MKDLYRCLDEYPEDLLLAIAGAWGIALPRDEAIRMVKRLGDAMLAPGANNAALAGLSPQAREALAYLVAQGGAAPARPTMLRYGALRRFGPARLRREQPWLAPAGALEELYYRGLLFRTYGQVCDYYGDLFLIPDELMALLPPLRAPSIKSQVEQRPEPQRVYAEGAALLEDLLALIVLLRRQPLPWPSHAEPLAETLQAWARDARLLGLPTPERLQFLWRLLERQKMVEHDGRHWRPALLARRWLHQRDAEQWLATFLAWRDDGDWDELLHLTTIQCEQADWHNPPVRARKRLGVILTALQEGIWYDLASLIHALRDHHPDYLRPDGDMDSWLIRDAQSGEYLRGIESWQAVEGALARYLLCGPLHWLGLIDLGGEGGGEAVVALRLTPAGKRLLAGLAPELPARPAHQPPAEIDGQMLVRIATGDTRYLRYQLERLATWQGQDDGQASYLLSEDSVWQSLNAGIQGEQILAFLRRIANDALPPLVERTLSIWTGRYGRVSLGRAVVLETLDVATMQEIHREPALAALLGESLGPTRCLVSDEHLEELVAQLKSRNIWPRLRR